MEENNYEKYDELEPMEEEQPGFTDKLIGVFTEPSKMFAELAKFPAKISSWLIPLFIFVLVLIFTIWLPTNNPILKQEMIEKQITEVEKQLNERVKKGEISRTTADQQIEGTREYMTDKGGLMFVFQAVGILITVPIMMIVIGAFYFIIMKFVLKGDGSFGDAMTAMALPFYISMIGIILVAAVSMVTDKFFGGFNVASLFSFEDDSTVKILLSKLDVFSIWYYYVASIGFAALFKIANKTKVMITVFGIWIGVTLLFLLASGAVPMLKNFIK